MLETEKVWSGKFGGEYTARHISTHAKERRARDLWWAKVLQATDIENLRAIMELGCGHGMNIESLREVLPAPTPPIDAIEINKEAASAARMKKAGVVYWQPLSAPIGMHLLNAYDLVFTRGVLIHQPPDTLPAIYDMMAALSRRYVMMAEYYNPTPVEVPYRGQNGLLWKRDFAAEFMQRHPYELVDYGFVYHLDPIAPQDDITYFLMEKKQ